MHIEHKAGEEVQVDWAGSTVLYIDTITGEPRKAYILLQSFLQVHILLSMHMMTESFQTG